MNLRLQATALFLLFLAVSLFGALPLQRCLCSGDVSIATDAPHPCDHCHDSENKEEAPSPCENGDCYVILTLPSLDQPVILDLRELPGLAPEANPLPCTAHSAPPQQAPFPAPLLRPPDDLSVPLHVLYGTFLI